ncbi:hypothetical protein GCM10026988_25430 [Vibrio panuliri]
MLLGVYRNHIISLQLDIIFVESVRMLTFMKQNSELKALLINIQPHLYLQQANDKIFSLVATFIR